MDLLLIRDHPAHTNHPEREAKQAIVKINDQYGLSLIWAKGSRWGDPAKGDYGHGFYCDEKQVEAALVVFIDSPENITSWEGEKQWSLANVPGGEYMLEPKGWLGEDDVEYLINRVRELGVAGWEEESTDDD